MKGANLILINLRKKFRKHFAKIIAVNMREVPQLYPTMSDCYGLCLSYCKGVVEALITYYPERKEVYNFPAIVNILNEAFMLACSDLA